MPGMHRFLERRMSADERRSLVEALRRGQEAAFGPDEYVEQESFVRASEIRVLAERAAIGPDVSVLDLCCGVAGPGRFLTRELGCDYVGVDSSEGAVAIAAERARGLPCRFEVAHVPPLPAGTFEVVLLLETMLAFRDKRSLLEEVGRALSAGGRFAFTLEEGVPLTESERARMPAADTVWLTPLDEMHTLLAQAGFAVRWEEEWSESHREVAAALADAYAADSNGDRFADRTPGAGRAPGRPPAVERLARDRARSQVRAGGGAAAGGMSFPRTAWSRHAPGKIRTCDLCLRRAALYPLSYGREGAVSVAGRLPSRPAARRRRGPRRARSRARDRARRS